MGIYKQEDIIGWENDKGEFFCYDCFDKEHKDDTAGWTPVEQKEDYLYLCDKCKQRA